MADSIKSNHKLNCTKKAKTGHAMLVLRKITSNKTRIFGAIVLAMVLIVAFCEVVGWPFLRLPVERFMQSKLERNVNIDSPFKLKLIGGLKLKAGGFRISAQSEFKVPYLVSAKGLELQLRYSDLWGVETGNPYVIKSIKADRIDAYFSRGLDGKSTWQFNKNDTDHSVDARLKLTTCAR